MLDSKVQNYRDEAEKCRRLAARETCPDAREYYEALCRDYIKLAERELCSPLMGEPGPVVP